MVASPKIAFSVSIGINYIEYVAEGPSQEPEGELYSTSLSAFSVARAAVPCRGGRPQDTAEVPEAGGQAAEEALPGAAAASQGHLPYC